ncbi:MAG: SIS domain-containing protein, partial [Methanobacteriota archaeon]
MAKGDARSARRMKDAVDLILDSVRDTVASVDPAVVRRIVTTLAGARNVIIFGRGRSGLVGRALAMRLHHLGLRSFVVGETTTPPVRSKDVVVVVSGSGETLAVVITAQAARAEGAKLVAITENRGTSVGKLADIVVELS